MTPAPSADVGGAGCQRRHAIFSGCTADIGVDIGIDSAMRGLYSEP
jgi:hypothetical protein